MDALLSLSNDLAAAVAHASRAVFGVNARPRMGSSGVHWRPGLIVTANHTVQLDEDVTVTRPDGRTVPATVAGRDAAIDLAILEVEAPDVPVADLADSDAARVGHIVLALARGPRASWGIVSAIADGRGGAGGEPGLLTLDLTLYPGFSGGPLADARGRVVGISTSGTSRHFQLAIPAAAVNRAVEELVRRGRMPRAYLGVSTQTVRLPDSVRTRLALDQRTAVIVVDVHPGSPAAHAGLLIGDVVVALAGAPITTPLDVKAVLRPSRVGVSVVASIVRGGEAREVPVTIGERPDRR
jgi:S1-C subfamily serine protease